MPSMSSELKFEGNSKVSTGSWGDSGKLLLQKHNRYENPVKNKFGKIYSVTLRQKHG